MFSQADITQLKALGWLPHWTLEEGIISILKADFGWRPTNPV
jgi:nucleoside-diphosphate-sugar epimerase